MRALGAIGLALVLIAMGCGTRGKLESKEAVQTAIEAHLKERQNVMLSNMSLEVGEVKFAGDSADAEVQFRSKQSPDVAVGVHYKLRRVGDHWQVEKSNSSGGMGGSPHGGGMPSTPQPSHDETSLQSSH